MSSDISNDPVEQDYFDFTGPTPNRNEIALLVQQLRSNQNGDAAAHATGALAALAGSADSHAVLASSGCFPLLASYFSPGKPARHQLNASAVFARIAIAISSPYRTQICATGVVPAAVALLASSSSTSPECRANILNMLKGLAVSRDTEATLMRCANIVPTLMALVSTENQNEALCTRAIGVLSSLVIHERNRAVFVGAGIIPVAIRLLDSNKDAQTSAAGTIASLCMSPTRESMDSRTEIGRLGGIARLVRLLSHDFHALKCETVSALSVLVLGHSPNQCLLGVCGSSAFSAIVTHLRSSDPLLSHSSAILASFLDDENIEHLSHEPNLVTALMELLEKDDAPLSVLVRLALLNDRMRSEIGLVPGAVRLLTSIVISPTESSVTAAQLLSLLILTDSNKTAILLSGSLPTIFARAQNLAANANDQTAQHLTMVLEQMDIDHDEPTGALHLQALLPLLPPTDIPPEKQLAAAIVLMGMSSMPKYEEQLAEHALGIVTPLLAFPGSVGAIFASVALTLDVISVHFHTKLQREAAGIQTLQVLTTQTDPDPVKAAIAATLLARAFSKGNKVLVTLIARLATLLETGPHIDMTALQVLFTLSTVERHSTTFRQAGALPVLATLLHQGVDVMKHVWCLSVDRENRMIFAEMGLVQVLAEVYQHLPRTDPKLKHVLGGLSALCRHLPNGKLAAEVGLISPLLTSLSTVPQDALMWALQLVWYLAIHEENHPELLRAGASRVLTHYYASRELDLMAHAGGALVMLNQSLTRPLTKEVMQAWIKQLQDTNRSDSQITEIYALLFRKLVQEGSPHGSLVESEFAGGRAALEERLSQIEAKRIVTEEMDAVR